MVWDRYKLYSLRVPICYVPTSDEVNKAYEYDFDRDAKIAMEMNAKWKTIKQGGQVSTLSTAKQPADSVPSIIHSAKQVSDVLNSAGKKVTTGARVAYSRARPVSPSKKSPTSTSAEAKSTTSTATKVQSLRPNKNLSPKSNKNQNNDAESHTNTQKSTMTVATAEHWSPLHLPTHKLLVPVTIPDTSHGDTSEQATIREADKEQRSNTLLALDLTDFEKSKDPFEDVELETIDDLAELSHVLENDRTHYPPVKCDTTTPGPAGGDEQLFRLSTAAEDSTVGAATSITNTPPGCASENIHCNNSTVPENDATPSVAPVQTFRPSDVTFPDVPKHSKFHCADNTSIETSLTRSSQILGEDITTVPMPTCDTGHLGYFMTNNELREVPVSTDLPLSQALLENSVQPNSTRSAIPQTYEQASHVLNNSSVLNGLFLDEFKFPQLSLDHLDRACCNGAVSAGPNTTTQPVPLVYLPPTWLGTDSYHVTPLGSKSLTGLNTNTTSTSLTYKPVSTNGFSNVSRLRSSRSIPDLRRISGAQDSQQQTAATHGDDDLSYQLARKALDDLKSHHNSTANQQLTQVLPASLPSTPSPLTFNPTNDGLTSKNAVSSPISPLPNPYNTLSAECKNVVDSVVKMGFERGMVARAVQLLGADTKEVVDYMCTVNDLVEEGHSQEDVETAMLICECGREKVKDYLRFQETFMDLGFQKLAIQNACKRHGLDQETVLDTLTET